MRPLSLLILLALTAACNAKKATTSSGSINMEAPFIWEGPGFPKDLHMSVAYSTVTEQNKITEMADAWETAIVGTDFFNLSVATVPEKTDTIAGPNELRDSVFAVYKATNWPYPEYPDALAITQIFAIRYNAGESNEFVSIQEADIIMNYENFLFDDPDPLAFYYDFRTVLLHEMGHFLGLQHKPRSYPRANTVMYPSIFSASVEQKRAPLLVDRQDLAAKYSIILPLTAGNSSAIQSEPKVYKRKAGDKGELTKVILELRANGECIHRMDGIPVGRHHIKF